MNNKNTRRDFLKSSLFVAPLATQVSAHRKETTSDVRVVRSSRPSDIRVETG